MSELTGLDLQIIQSAKQHFLAEGILRTDMKQLALELGISRSTLYRHFSNAVDISFYAMKDWLIFLVSDDPSLYEGLSGYESFARYSHRLVTRLCDNLEIVRAIREFDMLYTADRQRVVPPEEYTAYIRSDSGSLGTALFEKGLLDGTISSRQPAGDASLAFFFTSISLVEHIMLRESTYQQEHGAAREYIDYTIDLMLQAIRA